MPGRLDPGDVAERVGAERDVIRPHDAPALIDPHDRGHVDHVVEIGEAMARVDQRRMRRVRGFDPGPRGLRTAVDGDADHDEAPILELVVDALPDRQVEATPSPRSIRDQEHLLAAVLAQRVQAPVEIGQREVRRLQRGQPPRALRRGHAEVRGALVDIERNGSPVRLGAASPLDTVARLDRERLAIVDQGEDRLEPWLIPPSPDSATPRVRRPSTP